MRIKSMKGMFFFPVYVCLYSVCGGPLLFTPQICLKSKSSIIKLFPLDWCLLINYATNNILITSIIVTNTVRPNIHIYFLRIQPPFSQMSQCRNRNRNRNQQFLCWQGRGREQQEKNCH